MSSNGISVCFGKPNAGGENSETKNKNPAQGRVPVVLASVPLPGFFVVADYQTSKRLLPKQVKLSFSMKKIQIR
ncbi:hypothetical protein [Alteromonas sp. H39]|uniref:hypothetical protein n=1 Tax=Alteromonas sp. H39 TaxID=3389876 RepID=UPI0039E08927